MSQQLAGRIDGNAIFQSLAPEMQARIGGLAIELVAAWKGIDHTDDYRGARPYQQAEVEINDRLHTTVHAAVPQLNEATPPRIPSVLGPVCRTCGCRENDACEGGCGWAEADLCTVCASGGATP